MITQLLDEVQHIEQLYLRGNFSYFNLDHLTDLQRLSLVGTIDDNFNVELFKYLCDQITFLKIQLTNIEDKTFFKLFDGHNFPYLFSFSIEKCNIKRFKKEFINQYPMLRNLFIIGIYL